MQAPKRWILDSREAYQRWFERHRPDWVEELTLSVEFARWEDLGPPITPIVDGRTERVSARNGPRVAYRAFPADVADTVAGLIYILAIQ